MSILIRAECDADKATIHGLTARAFADIAHSDGSEPDIIDGLRTSGDLTLSLVAEENSVIIGHIAFSPVAISDGSINWYGLGPVSVEPSRQGEGIGSQLVNAGLDALRQIGVNGCVLLGDSAYYTRFGFEHDPRLVYPGPPAEYFQLLLFKGEIPEGQVQYSPAFG